MLTQEEFKHVKKLAKLEIHLLEQEYHDILNHVDSAIYEHVEWLDEEQASELVRKRKNRRYASLTVELCSIMEQMLLQLYKRTYQKRFNSTQLMKTPAYRARTNMEILEAELGKQHIVLKVGKEQCSTALHQAFQTRNRLIHENFSFVTVVKEGSNEEETFEWILHAVKKYRKHLKYEGLA
ncbi:hypothetical protein HNR77_005392 [Paenibacillus sp. JGP012]|uniref:hypothetical protein n=1 Tax=Paenibacillus sp. JGP012 TaxID=2735914 RepID=UPI00161ABFF9|nr:hypothetical protein [Paenibacillus sp. JGP012]MBB6024284.1 hypothetical protein [Paenibacillus sp. JGP012]